MLFRPSTRSRLRTSWQRAALRVAALSLCTGLISGCQSALFASLNATPRGDVEQRRGLVFDARHDLALDVYRPADAQHAPIVVFFYGGSWTHGERAWYRFVGTALAERGVITVIPDYRKVPDVALDGFMHDAALAVAWTHRHAGEFGGDADDVFVMGHSSGGHIAGLLATDPQWLAAYGMQPRELAGFIGLAGVYTVLPDDADDDDMLAVFGSEPAQQRIAQPVSHVSGDEPPMLLLHGSADHEVDPANSRALADAMQAHGEDAQLKSYAGVGHSKLLFSMSHPLRSRAPTLSDVLDFVHAHPHAMSKAAERSTNRAGSPAPSAAVP
jgi:acetyl esterase/lipase